MVGSRLPHARQYFSANLQHAGQRSPGRRAVAVHPALWRGSIGRIPGRVRFREFRCGRSSRQCEGRTAHGLLGGQPVAGGRGSRRVVCAEFPRRVEGPRNARRRGQGTVQAAGRIDAPGPAASRPVVGGAMVLQLASRAVSGKWNLPVDLGRVELRRGLADPGRQSVRGVGARRSRVAARVAR